MFFMIEFKKLSIKNFIGDLPNIINANFDKIKAFIDEIFVNDTLVIKNASVEGNITANSITANNITITLENGNKTSVAELLDKIYTLEQTVKSLQQDSEN